MARHEHESSQPLVVGMAPDLEQARRVSRLLRDHGVEATDVKLAGSAAEEAEAHTRIAAAREEMEARAIAEVGQQAEAGALIGALAGAAIGVGGALLATSGDVSGRTAVFLAIVFVFTGLGAWVGATLSAMGSMGYDDSWEPTFERTTGSAWIAVRVRDSREAFHVRDLLHREGITLVEEHAAATHGAGTARR